MRYGGSFAPPLTDALLDQYTATIEGLDHSTPIYDVLSKLLTCAKAWWDAPESSGNRTKPHQSGQGTIVILDDEIQKQLFDVIPWDYECDSYGVVLEGISNETHRDLRNMAFHLLWFAKELTIDREPITKDKL